MPEPDTDLPFHPSAGHRALIRNAGWAARQTLRHHRAFAECWSGLLGLHYTGLKGEHESPHVDPDDHVAWHLRQSLLCAALDTSKLALEATLVGSYVQALMLTRHLFETWLQAQYAAIRPDQAIRWFNTAESGPPRQPNYESIIKEVLKSEAMTQSERTRNATNWVHKTISELRGAAHPSAWIVEQARGSGDELIALGGRYTEKWCRLAFDRGTLATIALLHEVDRLIPQPPDWRAELARLAALRNTEYPQDDDDDLVDSGQSSA